MSNNYVGKNSLARFLEKLYETFSKKGHAHSKADILDLPVIPSIEGLATETYVDKAVSEALANIGSGESNTSGGFVVRSEAPTDKTVLWVDTDDESDDTANITPIKGVHYWTDEDKAEIRAYVDEAILGGAW